MDSPPEGPPRDGTDALHAKIAELERTLTGVREDSDRYRQLFERSADAILIIDGETFIDCNAATVRMLRYRTKDELLQTHPSELSPEFQADGRSSFAKANEMMEIALRDGSHRFEWLHKRADGEVFPVEVLLTAMPGGGKPQLHTVWREITDRKRLEEELRQAQKMEAVGKLAGGIAHDFNNLLMAISGNAELLHHDLQGRSELAEHVAEILRASDRAASLVEQLLAYSRKQMLQPRVLDLNGVFGGLDRILERLLGEDVQVVRQLDRSPLPIMVDPGQLEQVVLNLATNARDAMPGGGTLTFATSRITIGTGRNPDQGLLPAGSYAVLSVSDTGTGIAEEHLPRLFDPFWTTKDQGEGTGLGLSTVYGIVRQSGGDVTVSSSPGKGSVFRVLLPICEREIEPEAEGEELSQPELDGTESILLVEDEPTLTRLVEKVLVQRGYTVNTAANGCEALTLVDSASPSFDLLLTDVIMPRMGGVELAERLRESRPELRVLFMSGYSDSILLRKGLQAGEAELVTKPFSPVELLSKIREVLDRDRNGLSPGAS